jgi:acetyltransferase-like isoleucine patch superfamily enzyme
LSGRAARYRRYGRLLTLALIAFTPSFIKRLAYRWLFGYRLGRDVRISFTLLDAQDVDLGPSTRIGPFCLITRVGRLETGPHVAIGPLNVIRGGERVSFGAYATVMRLNVLNAIPDHDCTTDPVSILELGDGSIIVSGHRVDFTDHVTIGRNVIVGGRNSSLWTHNRQETAPISIGDFCYLGSEVRLAPGSALPAECILAMGSVHAGKIEASRSLVAGNPARVVRPLTGDDLARIRRKTRGDIPDDLYERG